MIEHKDMLLFLLIINIPRLGYYKLPKIPIPYHLLIHITIRLRNHTLITPATLPCRLHYPHTPFYVRILALVVGFGLSQFHCVASHVD